MNFFKKQIDDSESWYEKRRRGIPLFWKRLGGIPSFNGLTVLDLGCDNGNMCFFIAKQGAKRVIGIDINAGSISFAKKKLEEQPKFKDKIEFICGELQKYNPGMKFDIIVSRDTFEHIINFNDVLNEVVRRLKPKGRLYVGFGPLWNSPYGGHGRMKMPIPWGHVLLPEKVLLKWVNLFYSKKFDSIEEMGLNRLALRDYERLLLKNPSLKTIYWKVNHGDRFLSRLFAKIARIPLLREYFSHDLYAVLEKK